MVVAKKKIAITLGKILISACLLAFLLSRIDVRVFLRVEKEFSVWFFFPLVLLFIATTFLGSWRWKLLLACHGLRQSILSGVYLYLVGYFYNNFLPTAIGGDIMRGYEASKRLGSPCRIFGSIVVERVFGLLASLCIALVFLPLAWPPRLLILLVAGLNVAAWGGLLIFVLAFKASVGKRLIGRLPGAVQEKLAEIASTLDEYRKSPGLVGKSFLVAVLYQGALIVLCWIVARFAGIDSVSLRSYLVFVPIVWVVALVPISLNSLGVNEVSFAFFFGLLGAPREQGILVSLILFGTNLISSAIGGAVMGDRELCRCAGAGAGRRERG